MKKAPKIQTCIKNLLRLLPLVLAALVIGVNVYEINASRLGGDPIPMPFGVGAATVLSGSMEPALSVGDLVIVAESDGYAVGDVIVYLDGRTAVSHRIVSVSENEIVTRGDANNAEDEPITPEKIKGRIVLALPLIGFLINAVKTPMATACILFLTLFLLERSFHSEKRRDEEKLRAIKEEIEKIKQQSDNR